jgi:opacity protein-like surface antigen
MKRICLAVLVLVFAANTFAQAPLETDKDPDRERLGGRIGYVATTSDLDNSFGGGLDLALHFIHRFKKTFSVDFTLGAFYLGETSRDDILVNGATASDESMRIITFTVAPMIELPVNDRTNFYMSGGVGLYTVSLLVDSGVFQFDFTDNHVGINGGLGVLRHVTENWFLDLNIQIHKFWTSDDIDDIFFVYSDGDSNPLFYQITAGAMLRLF